MAKYTGMARGLRNAWQMREAEEAQDTMRDRNRVENAQWQQETDRRRAVDMENRRQFEAVRGDRRAALDMERAGMEQKAAEERDSKWAESLYNRNEGFPELISAPSKEAGLAAFNAKGQFKITDYDFDPATGDLRIFAPGKPEPLRISGNVVSKLRNIGRAMEERGLKMEGERADTGYKKAQTEKALREPTAKPNYKQSQIDRLVMERSDMEQIIDAPSGTYEPRDIDRAKAKKSQIDAILQREGMEAAIPQQKEPQGDREAKKNKYR